MNRNEMLALLQAEQGFTFVNVKFLSPIDVKNGKIEWNGEYDARGKTYIYKCGPEFSECLSGDLVVVPAKNSFAVARVECVDFFPPSDHDFTFNIRRVVSKIDRNEVDKMKRQEDDAMRRMARAEASQKLSELRKHFDFRKVEMILNGKLEENGVIE